MSILIVCFTIAIVILLATVTAPLLRNSFELVEQLLHVLVASILYFSLIRSSVSQVTGEFYTRQLLLTLLISALVLAIITGNIAKPHFATLLLFGALFFLSFRSADWGGDIPLTALTITAPVFLVSSFIKIDVTKFLSSCFGLGFVLLISLVLNGAIVQGRLTLAGENAIWIARMACIGMIAAIVYTKPPWLVRAVLVTALSFVAWESGSRGPILAFFTALSFFCATRVRGAFRALFCIAAVLLASVTVAVSGSTAIGERTNEAVTLEWRQRTWLQSIKIIRESPFVGQGAAADDPTIGLATYPHNFLLELGIQAGFVGMLIAIILVARAWRRAVSLTFRTMLLAVLVFTIPSGSAWSAYELWLLLPLTIPASPGSQRKVQIALEGERARSISPPRGRRISHRSTAAW